MIRTYQTKLKGMLALTTSYHTEKSLQKEKSLYKFQVLEVGKGDDLVLGQYHFLMVYLEGDASFAYREGIYRHSYPDLRCLSPGDSGNRETI